MENKEKLMSLKETFERMRVPKTPDAPVTIYRFDVFKGRKDEEGKISKIKSVGSAYIRDGLRTYTLHLKTLLKDTYYLLPNTRPSSSADFVILTREPAQNAGKKYFWNHVGEGTFLDGVNHGVMQLAWDIFTSDDIYMTLHPINVSDVAEAVNLASAAA